MFDIVLFDLDGTLTDSSPGILNSMRETFSFYGVEITEDRLYTLIGPPIRESFAELIGADRAADAVASYRNRYNSEGLFENAVYPGIVEMLDHLKQHGIALGIATSKARTATMRILKHFGLDNYFDAVGAAADDGTHGTKEQVVREVLALLNPDGRKTAVLVGDRLFDMEGASACGLPAIGVLWGYGSVAELQIYNPLLLANEPKEVASFILFGDYKHVIT